MQTATIPAKSPAVSDHLISVPDSEWAFWRCVCLRGAGFPAQGILKLAAAPELTAAAKRVMAARQEAEIAQKNTLDQINLELDLLRSAGEWDDKKKRKILLDARRAVNESKIPRSLPESHAADLFKKLEIALRCATEERNHFEEVFSQSVEQISESIRDIAGMPSFREAVTWQNRAAVRTALEPLMRETRSGSRSSRQKQHEELVANYWQRYCVKNDTIGFFGPVGWARFVPEGSSIVTKPGHQLTTARKVYWEAWAIEAMGAAIESKYNVRQWIAPILIPFLRVGNTVLYHPRFGPIRITPKQAAIIRACNGRDTAKQIAEKILQSATGRGQSEGDVYQTLDEMARKGFVFWTFNIPLGPHPEKALRAALQRIEEPDTRQSALGLLDRLDSARLRVEAAGGNLEVLGPAFDYLEEVFTQLTGLSATRNQGQVYAGRTLVYEDCRRDVEVSLGPELLTSIAEPLSLLLGSARWLTARVAEVYKQRCAAIFSELANSTGTASIDAAQLWGEAMPLFFEGASDLITPIQEEFQRKWGAVLQLEESVTPVKYSCHELRQRIMAEFQAAGPGWVSARYHSPDIMIAAGSEEAILKGDCVFVMGEMHVSKNTLDASLFVNQHPSPDELLCSVDQDLKLRVVPLGLKTDDQGCRTNPSLIGKNSFRLEYLPDSFTDDRAKAIPLSSIVLENQSGELVARTRDGQHCMKWIDLVGALLSVLVIDCFKIIAPRAHTPRISIDRLVLKRESWRFSPSALEFASCSSPAERFLQARTWARAHGIPRFAFFKVPVEIKPAYLDFESPILIDIFAKMIRRTLAAGLPDATIDVSEMLPEPNQVWLPDSTNQRYTSELRIVAVDTASLKP